jgi:hypothetical protein
LWFVGRELDVFVGSFVTFLLAQIFGTTVVAMCRTIMFSCIRLSNVLESLALRRNINPLHIVDQSPIVSQKRIRPVFLVPDLDSSPSPPPRSDPLCKSHCCWIVVN